MLSRRLVALSAGLFGTGIVAPPRPLRAAAAETELAGTKPPAPTWREALERQLRPTPKLLPRRRMDLDFAVLLMRTTYATADELDFMPMDEFQKAFFLLRQAEWDVYKQALPRVTQGDLSDPAYFDFISFAQYATISACMRNGRRIFTELVDANGTALTVVRDPRLADNALLPAAMAERVGDALYGKLCDKYAAIAPRVPREPTASALVDGVRQITRDHTRSHEITRDHPRSGERARRRRAADRRHLRDQRLPAALARRGEPQRLLARARGARDDLVAAGALSPRRRAQRLRGDGRAGVLACYNIYINIYIY